MVKHVVMWQLKDEMTKEEKEAVKQEMKNGLESLRGQIPGLIDIEVVIDCLPESNVDVLLNTTFMDEASLEGYAHHPKHLIVADSKVRPFTKARMCMDFKK